MLGREATERAESIDPRDVLMNALELMTEQLRLAGIEVVTVMPDTCRCVFGHAIQMEQVILNLLTNARDTIDESEGRTKITLRVFEGDNVVYTTAQNTGGAFLAMYCYTSSSRSTRQQK